MYYIIYSIIIYCILQYTRCFEVYLKVLYLSSVLTLSIIVVAAFVIVITLVACMPPRNVYHQLRRKTENIST